MKHQRDLSLLEGLIYCIFEFHIESLANIGNSLCLRYFDESGVSESEKYYYRNRNNCICISDQFRKDDVKDSN